MIPVSEKASTFEHHVLMFEARLAAVEQAIDDHTYVPGQWQGLLVDIQSSDESVILDNQQAITRTSNKLHRRNGFVEFPYRVGLLMEVTIAVISIYCLTASTFAAQVVGAILLPLCLQPLLKLLAASLIGLKYAYSYLWYFEPRFKMEYGSYLLLGPWQKVFLQMAGSIGTPLALLAGFFLVQGYALFSYLLLAGAIGALGMQILAFVAAWQGVSRVGPFYLKTLTTPAMLASELKRILSSR